MATAFSAQSGSGEGLHIWVRTDKGKTTKFTDLATKENVGHIKSTGGYVVGPSSVHPSGGLYRVVGDGEIPYIPFADLLKFFSDYIQAEKPLPELSSSSSHYQHDTIDIPIEKIWTPVKPIRVGDELQGGHPVHGSTGGKNFSINTRKNVWTCWRCGTGGSSLEAIAVSHGLLDCSESRPGCLRGELFKEVMKIAEEEYGWTRPIKTTPPRPTILPQLPTDEQFDVELFQKPGITTNSLPDELPENVQVTLIDGYPRIGKTHWSEIQAIKAGTANIIANTHSVIEQHLRIFKEHRKSGQTAVHLEGRNRCCLFEERKSCKGCNHYPYTSDPADRGRFLAYIDDTLHDSTAGIKNEACSLR
jgi:hypothetical protein